MPRFADSDGLGMALHVSAGSDDGTIFSVLFAMRFFTRNSSSNHVSYVQNQVVEKIGRARV